MATSLYDLSVPTFLQTVSAVAGFLDRAARHCAETGADPDDFVHARLFDDMAPFHFQIECVAHHDNSERNKFNPDPTKEVRWGPQTWEEMMIGWLDYTMDAQNLRTETASK